tara:strand:- start:243 stop:440 length:198 start_codon:yes stop_codon:yes gene_type:complete
MTITLTESVVYIAATVVLIAVQLYQQYLIRNLQKETRRLWEQVATSTIILFTKTEELDKQIKDTK